MEQDRRDATQQLALLHGLELLVNLAAGAQVRKLPVDIVLSSRVVREGSALHQVVERVVSSDSWIVKRQAAVQLQAGLSG